MSDNSPCYFNRHDIKIISNKNLFSGDKTLVLTVSDGDWEILSNKEFVCKIIKSHLLGCDSVFIEGDTHKFLKFMINILPLFTNILPTTVCVDVCRGLFLDRIHESIFGVCFDVNMPLKHEYFRDDRSLFKEFGEYRTPEKYRETFLSTVDSVGADKYKIFRINDTIVKNDNLESTVSFMQSHGFKVVLRSMYI
jgi:hypothetical protein